CAQQNAFDPILSRYIRFPSIIGSHGWQWSRELYMNQAAVWTYDLETNLWRNRRPFPWPNFAPLRRARWDAHKPVVVVFAGEGAESSLETWVFDVDHNVSNGKKPAREPDPSGNRDRVLIAVPDKNLIYLEDCTSKPREQQMWSYRCEEVPRGIHGVSAPMRTKSRPPEDVVVSVLSAKEVEVTWKVPPKGKEVAFATDKPITYVVER